MTATDTGKSGPVMLIDIPTLAQQLNVTERFIRRLINERRIPYLKIGKFIRFHPNDVATWVAARRIET
ncbi:MAG: helix-turn-helix domain-containing protein [Actinomycetota bacterium]|nr:helix-turn-helix domain-containing protein [Actinomycetota bacterium]